MLERSRWPRAGRHWWGFARSSPTGGLATVELDVERWRDVDHGTGTATILVTPRSLESG
jgi:hypothetical protein